MLNCRILFIHLDTYYSNLDTSEYLIKIIIILLQCMLITNSYYSALVQFPDQLLYYFIFYNLITFAHEVTFSIDIHGMV